MTTIGNGATRYKGRLIKKSFGQPPSKSQAVNTLEKALNLIPSLVGLIWYPQAPHRTRLEQQCSERTPHVIWSASQSPEA